MLQLVNMTDVVFLVHIAGRETELPNVPWTTHCFVNLFFYSMRLPLADVCVCVPPQSRSVQLFSLSLILQSNIIPSTFVLQDLISEAKQCFFERENISRSVVHHLPFRRSFFTCMQKYSF